MKILLCVVGKTFEGGERWAFCAVICNMYNSFSRALTDYRKSKDNDCQNKIYPDDRSQVNCSPSKGLQGMKEVFSSSKARAKWELKPWHRTHLGVCGRR